MIPPRSTVIFDGRPYQVRGSKVRLDVGSNSVFNAYYDLALMDGKPVNKDSRMQYGVSGKLLEFA